MQDIDTAMPFQCVAEKPCGQNDEKKLRNLESELDNGLLCLIYLLYDDSGRELDMLKSGRKAVRDEWNRLPHTGLRNRSDEKILAGLINEYFDRPENRRQRQPGKDVRLFLKHLRTTIVALQKRPGLSQSLTRKAGRWPKVLRQADTFEDVDRWVRELRRRFLALSRRLGH